MDGVAAAGDPAVMALLAARGVFVEACPGSNLRTGAIATLADHPLRAFLDAGIPCGLNTDDRTLFDVDLAGEISRARETFSLTDRELAGMTKAAREAAFDPAALARAVGLAAGKPVAPMALSRIRATAQQVGQKKGEEAGKAKFFTMAGWNASDERAVS